MAQLERDRAKRYSRFGKIKRAVATVFAAAAIMGSQLYERNVIAAPAPEAFTLLS